MNTIWAGQGNVYSTILNCKTTVKSIIYYSDTSFHENKKFYKMIHFKFQPLNLFKKMDKEKNIYIFIWTIIINKLLYNLNNMN